MKYSYKPQGVCSRQILIDIEDGVIQSLEFIGGCPGNLQGIAALVKGQKAEEVIARLEGIHCGNKTTSCPDQLAKALAEISAMQPA